MNGLIFDLDGVIAITEKLHKEAFEIAFAGFNIDISKYDWDKDFAGKGHRYIVDTVFGASPANDRFIDKWVYHYQLIAKKAEPVPGLKEFISKYSHIPMIIATGSARKSAVIVLNALNINLPLVAMEDVSNPKPDPGLFLLAACKIKVQPKDCTVFEDSIYGIRAAKSASMKVIALTTTHDIDVLKQENPDYIINDFTDLLSKIHYPQFDER